MSAASDQGRVVWHDLMSTEPEISENFFTQLFDWSVQPVDKGPAGLYRMLRSGDAEVGGIVPLDKTRGAPSHWIAYVAVEDVDAAAGRVPEHGGKLVVPPTDVPDQGRFCVFADPTGASIAAWKGVKPYAAESESSTPPGQFIWEELLSTDVETSKAFCVGVFGWTTKEMDMGEIGIYTIFSSGDRDRAGLMQKPDGDPHPSHWLSYVSVADVDAMAARAKELGGTVFVEPCDIPNIGRFSVAADPSGAMFAVYKSAQS